MLSTILTTLTTKISDMSAEDLMAEAKSVLEGQGITDATESQLKDVVWGFLKEAAMKKIGLGGDKE